MRIVDKVKSFINCQINKQKLLLKSKKEELKREVFEKYILPITVQYLRELVVKKGVNPDAPLVAETKSPTFQELMDNRLKKFNFHQLYMSL